MKYEATIDGFDTSPDGQALVHALQDAEQAYEEAQAVVDSVGL